MGHAPRNSPSGKQVYRIQRHGQSSLWKTATATATGHQADPLFRETQCCVVLLDRVNWSMGQLGASQFTDIQDTLYKSRE
jgi:hypothetical protein